MKLAALLALLSVGLSISMSLPSIHNQQMVKQSDETALTRGSFLSPIVHPNRVVEAWEPSRTRDRTKRRRHRHRRRRRKRRRQKMKKKHALPLDRDIEKSVLVQNKSKAALTLHLGKESLEKETLILASSQDKQKHRPKINHEKNYWNLVQNPSPSEASDGLYSRLASWLGFGKNRKEKRFETSARLDISTKLSKHDENIDRWRQAKDRKEGWSEWSPCSATCGQGISERKRSCGYNCVETSTQPCWISNCTNTTHQHSGLPKNLEELLTILVKSLEEELGFEEKINSNDDVDKCTRWMQCRAEGVLRHLAHMSSMPSCPCQYPSAIAYQDKIWDSRTSTTHRWRDVSGDQTHMEVYHRGAKYCIRSSLQRSLSAQLCCYDSNRDLITRGRAAGSPMVVSPEASPKLHRTVDVLPWIACRGDFTRYHILRPPNNGNKCPPNPSLPEYQKQLQLANYF